MTDPWPQEVRLTDKGRRLTIVFDSGESFDLPAELLRVESPSAEVKGHGPGQEQLVFGKRHVSIAGIEQVGTYALRLLFDDGHTTGIYTWTYLAKLGRTAPELWQTYLHKLAAANKARDP